MRTILIKPRLIAALLAAAGLAALTGACGSEDEGAGEEVAAPAISVVASTPQLADIAGQVGGERTEVVGLLAANADPHDHEPRPSDVEAVAEADLVLQSGGHLDIWMDDVVESSGTDARAIELIDSVETIAGGHDHVEDEHGHSGDEHEDEDEHGHGDRTEGRDDHADDDVDPHWWQDPTNVVAAAEAIRDRLAQLDPEGRRAYQRNTAAYLAELERLDAAIAECMDSIPAGDRKLVTSHDAFGYFARRYGIEVVGTAIPALTTQAQPSAGETAELVELIREEDVPAVFPEAGLGDRIEAAIAGETDAEVGGTLWADTLGPEGSGAETYIGATAQNARTLAEGLSRGEEDCPDLPTR